MVVDSTLSLLYENEYLETISSTSRVVDGTLAIKVFLHDPFTNDSLSILGTRDIVEERNFVLNQQILYAIIQENSDDHRASADKSREWALDIINKELISDSRGFLNWPVKISQNEK